MIEKSVPRDHRLSSLGKPRDAKRRSSGGIFLSYPHTHDGFLYSFVYVLIVCCFSKYIFCVWFLLCSAAHSAFSSFALFFLRMLYFNWFLLSCGFKRRLCVAMGMYVMWIVLVLLLVKLYLRTAIINKQLIYNISHG